jgi:PIN domain nuclease of toxin-antitoxin system
MTCLLDTHALFWHLFEPARLSPAARQAIDDGEAGKATLIVLSLVLDRLIVIASNRLRASLIIKDQTMQASPRVTWLW